MIDFMSKLLSKLQKSVTNYHFIFLAPPSVWEAPNEGISIQHQCFVPSPFELRVVILVFLSLWHLFPILSSLHPSLTF